MKPVCQNCFCTWTWWDAAKHTFSIRKYIVCPYCQNEQYYSKGTKLFEFILCYSALFIILTMITRADTIMTPIKAYFTFFACYNIIFPFFLRLSNTKKGLFQSFRAQ